jgi:hypothetical protein
MSRYRPVGGPCDCGVADVDAAIGNPWRAFRTTWAATLVTQLVRIGEQAIADRRGDDAAARTGGGAAPKGVPACTRHGWLAASAPRSPGRCCRHHPTPEPRRRRSLGRRAAVDPAEGDETSGRF